ncbi:MAG: hypothetical protein KC496_22460, partial [Anaerolineae bacterium]|nr:hypothetical protein [Anaerolineae bacterium]
MNALDKEMRYATSAYIRQAMQQGCKEKTMVENSPSEAEENGVLFGIKWSLVGMGLTVAMLAGCSFFADENKARYNEVQGERHIPILNPNGAGFAADQARHVEEEGPAMPPIAPMDPAYQPERDVIPVVPESQPEASHYEGEWSWRNLMFWEHADGEESSDPRARIKALEQMPRKLPEGNAQAGVEMAAPAPLV